MSMSGESQASMSHDTTGDRGVHAVSADDVQLDHAWEGMLHQLALYHRACGHCFVPLRCRENPELGAWLHEQIRLFHKGRLSQAKQHALEGLGLEWDFGESKGSKKNSTSLAALKMAERNTAAWERAFAALLDFKAARGHTHVPAKWRQNPPLGSWVTRQRKLYQQGTLPAERQQRLNEIGFALKSEFVHNTYGWEARFAELVAFQQQHGHLHVTLKNESSPGLMHWRDNQRVNLRAGTLTPERKARLDALGFEWECPGRIAPHMEEHNATLWERMMTLLLDYKAAHGHCQVPSTWKEHPQLAKWVTRQRMLYQQGTLAAERQQRLDEIGFAWKSEFLHNTHGWEARFAELVAFQQQHGHLHVTLKNESSPGLMHWRDNQRVNLRAGTLTPERQARLDAIGFEWVCPGRISVHKEEHFAAVWELMFTRLLDYKAAHGHTLVPGTWKEHPQLAKWVQRQRMHHQRGQLPVERQQRLADIGFAWKSDKIHFAQGWEERYAQFVAFKEQHGHLHVTLTNQTAPGLMNWRDNQRIRLKSGAMKPEQKAKLDAIGFDWQPPGYTSTSILPYHNGLWDQVFQRLVVFKEQHGHCKVPATWPEDQALAEWVRRQRKKFQHADKPVKDYARLSPEQITRLAALGFDLRASTHAAARPRDSISLWERGFARLTEFHRQHGHADVPSRPKNVLREWVVQQRRDREHGRLHFDQITRLDALRFSWKPSQAARTIRTGPRASETTWNQRFAELQAFIATHGHTRIPKNKTEFKILRGWGIRQRVYHRRGSLKPMRQQQLDAIGFDWCPGGEHRPHITTRQRGRSSSSEARYAELLAFHAEHGHAEVPTKYPANPLLGNWVSNTRMSRRKGQLSQERIAQLDALGFRWVAGRNRVVNSSSWERRYAELLDFQQRTGHANVPSTDKVNRALAQRVNSQRYKRRKGTLSAAQIERLNAIGV